MQSLPADSTLLFGVFFGSEYETSVCGGTKVRKNARAGNGSRMLPSFSSTLAGERQLSPRPWLAVDSARCFPSEPHVVNVCSGCGAWCFSESRAGNCNTGLLQRFKGWRKLGPSSAPSPSACAARLDLFVRENDVASLERSAGGQGCGRSWRSDAEIKVAPDRGLCSGFHRHSLKTSIWRSR